MADNGGNLGFASAAGGRRAVITGSRYVNSVLTNVLSVGPMGGQPAEFTPITSPAITGAAYQSPNRGTLVYPAGGSDFQKVDLTGHDAPTGGADRGKRDVAPDQRLPDHLIRSSTLYSRPLYGNNTVNQSINGAVAYSGSNALVRLASNDHWVVFRTETAASVYELYATDLGSPQVNLPIQTYLPDLRLAR